GRVARDLGDDRLAVLGAASAASWALPRALIDEDVAARGRDARVVGLDVASAADAAQGAAKLGAAALEHLLDAPFGAFVAEPSGDGDAIAVQRRGAVARGDEDVVLAVVTRDEAVAGRVHAQGAGDPTLGQPLFGWRRRRRGADDANATAGRLFQHVLVYQMV